MRATAAWTSTPSSSTTKAEAFNARRTVPSGATEGFTGLGWVFGREIACLSDEVQVLCHLNYEPDETDRRDMRLLAESRGFTLPATYER